MTIAAPTGLEQEVAHHIASHVDNPENWREYVGTAIDVVNFVRAIDKLESKVIEKPRENRPLGPVWNS